MEEKNADNIPSRYLFWFAPLYILCRCVEVKVWKYIKTVYVRSLGKPVSFVFTRVLMFSSTSSRTRTQRNIMTRENQTNCFPGDPSVNYFQFLEISLSCGGLSFLKTFKGQRSLSWKSVLYLKKWKDSVLFSVANKQQFRCRSPRRYEKICQCSHAFTVQAGYLDRVQKTC